MEFLNEYGLFVAKAITVVVSILAVIGGIVALSSRGRARGKERLEVKSLNRRYEDMAHTLQAAILPKREFKQALKLSKMQRKAEQKGLAGPSEGARKRIFVLNFHGDIMASAVTSLRQEITAVLTVARPADEVLLRLESAGGLVHAYGLAASQLLRIKAKKLALTVAVDKIAASGGYMMACVADRIIAAPFAILGSIGVVSQVPNFHRLLEKNDIDFEQFTAGEHKRTVTVFGENTDEGRRKFREELEDVHRLFKEFVREHRRDLDIARVATGEHWYGSRALEHKLVDELRTSDDYLLESRAAADLYEVSYVGKRHLARKLMSFAARTLGGGTPRGS